MRMRKLPWAEDFLKEQPVVIKTPSEQRGKWHSLLNREVLHLEIGCGKGDYWTKMALQYPEYGWIAVEKENNVAALAVRKYTNLEADTSHMRFINQDAETIDQWFAEGEIDVIHLNFSDPWPKKRAHKKRLSNHTFIAQYAKILTADGELQMKTDNTALFEYSILEFQKEGWFLHEFSVDYRREEHEEDVITEYEHRFLEKEQPIYRAVWKKHPEKETNS